MHEMKELIPDKEIERVHGNANFGGMSKREVVNQGVLKCASGYYQGSTSTQILKEHGLINAKYELTAKGKMYLWAAFSTKHSVQPQLPQQRPKAAAREAGRYKE